MPMDNKPDSGLKDNRYANAEVEVVCGEGFEKAYNDYLNRRVSMAMRHIAEYVDFNEISEKDEPGEVLSAIQSILERVYVLREDGKEKVKIFIKGAPKENYDSFFEEGVKAAIGVDAMCDLDRNRELHSYLRRRTAQG